MALVKYGPLAAAVSGTIGGSVFSHNRGGSYVRRWAKPHIVSSDAAELAKATMSTCSRLWGALTDGERAAWKSASVENPSVNRLGESRTLSGHQAFNQINARALRMTGTPVRVPPYSGPPNPAFISAFACDISDAEAEIVFAPTPLGAGIHLWTWAALTYSAGIQYVSNRMRLLDVSPAAQASPLDIYADLVARFGDLQAGYVIHIRIQTADEDTGLVSGFSSYVATVTA